MENMNMEEKIVGLQGGNMHLALVFGVFLLISGRGRGLVSTQLAVEYQENACPNLEQLVMRTLSGETLTDPTTPATLLCLLFHDCQVQGLIEKEKLNSFNIPLRTKSVSLSEWILTTLIPLRRRAQSAKPGAKRGIRTNTLSISVTPAIAGFNEVFRINLSSLLKVTRTSSELQRSRTVRRININLHSTYREEQQENNRRVNDTWKKPWQLYMQRQL